MTGIAERLRRRLRATPAPAPTTLPGPEAVTVQPRNLRMGGHWVRTLAVTGYPREVGPGWLQPLLAFPAAVDTAIHLDPIPPALAADRLRRQIARLESDQAMSARRGRVGDPHVDAAVDDAHDLARGLARGQQKLFRAAIYLTVHAEALDELEALTARVQAVASGLLLDTHPTTFRSLQGWTATLPVAVDPVGTGRTLDTSAAAALFPFTSPDLPGAGERGVLIGTNPHSAGIVTHDRWGQDAYGSVTVARSGAGKSYLAKLDVLRSLFDGVRCTVIDPENEYERLCTTVGGAHIRLGAPGVRVNPLDLTETPDPLTDRALFLHGLVAVLTGDPLTGGQRAALDRGIITTYERAGITGDPRTWSRPAPLLRDLAAALEHDRDPAGGELAGRLQPHVNGTHGALWDGPTTTRADRHLVVWCLRDLADQLKPAATMVALDAVWRQAADATRRDLVVVDEAWLLMQHDAAAHWLYRMAKAARKRWTALAVLTQDAADLLGSELGRTVVANAGTHVLLAQAPQVIDEVAEAFGLSRGERDYLTAAERGEGLLACGRNRTAFRALASPAEHELITTDPAQQAELNANGEEEIPPP